ncbi:hypothetical protein GQ457_01G037760 [Hibiscus cannabinus]
MGGSSPVAAEFLAMPALACPELFFTYVLPLDQRSGIRIRERVEILKICIPFEKMGEFLFNVKFLLKN